MIKKNILVCPLDWGLGHATRCVPIIRQFLKEGHNVIIGADNNPLAFLTQEFPELKTITIPGYEIEYNEKGSTLKLFYESIKFYNFINKEKEIIDQIVEEYDIDMLISDNRYGIYSEHIESVIITHQLFVKAPIGESIAHKKIEQLLSKFDEVWIPDYERENNLSGDLAHLKPFKQQHKFIGPLSRFKKGTVENEIKYDVCTILSGPEPQRTIFEKLLIKQIEKHNLKAVVVRGLPSENEELKMESKELKIFNHLPTEELHNYIQQSKMVVCRAGYSSIMDLAVLGKKALLVPTPGQTEQEYLAEYHFNQGNFYTEKQNEFDIQKGLSEIEKFKPNLNFETNFKLDGLLKND